MEKYYKKDVSKKSVETRESRVEQKRPRIELNLDDILVDPGFGSQSMNSTMTLETAVFFIRLVSYAKRAYLQLGPCKPFGHIFPRTKDKDQTRGFVEKWLHTFDWLEYSVQKDAAYCFYCYLFKPPNHFGKGTDAFSKVGFRNRRTALDDFKKHTQAIDGYHTNARKRVADFKNPRQSVTHVWSRKDTKEEEEYKVRMYIICDIVRFLLMQALAFRGHDESKSSSNRGNLLEMLEWYRKKDPIVSSVTSENAPGNNQMTSPDIQKDLVRACAEETSEAIKNEMGDCLFAVLVDEARDASIKEQMAVIARYVNDQGHVIERFLGIQHVSNTTSHTLKIALDAMLAKYGLSISRVRGQGYDGASNMRGQFHGLQRKVLDENPYAFYIHCFAHQLQLVVVSVAKCCSSVFDFFNYTTMIVNTVSASCKRKDQLLQDHHEKLVEQLERCEIFSGREKNQETSLARPGDTRWGTHHKTLARIQLMWASILEVLENIGEDANDGDKKTQAVGLIEKMETFEYVFILHLMIRVLGKTQELSLCLQRKNQNIVRAQPLEVGALQPPATAPRRLPPHADLPRRQRRLHGARSQQARAVAAVGPFAGAAAEPRVEGQREPDAGRRRGGGDDAQGAGGSVRGRRRVGGVDAVRGAGGVLQPPHVRGAAQGGGGGVRVPAPRRHHHPLPRRAVRARRRRRGRREEGLRQVVASAGQSLEEESERDP